MDRLTERHEDCVRYRGKALEYAGRAGIVDMANRLADYEDTGFTPEEIDDLACTREISPEAEYAINKHADSIIERLDKLLKKTDEDARIRELAAADKEGRVVALPKKGSTVYYIGGACGLRVVAGVVVNSNLESLKARVMPAARDYLVEVPVSSLYTSREEAERALEECKNA